MPQQFEWSHNSCWSLWGEKQYLRSLKAEVPVVPTWSWKCGRFLRPSWSLVHEVGLEKIVSAIYKGASSSTANQLRCKKEPKPAMGQMFLQGRTVFFFIWAVTRGCRPQSGWSFPHQSRLSGHFLSDSPL